MVRRFLSRFASDESGATAIEYALLLAGIFLVLVGAATLAGNNFGQKFNNAAGDLTGAMS